MRQWGKRITKRGWKGEDGGMEGMTKEAGTLCRVLLEVFFTKKACGSVSNISEILGPNSIEKKIILKIITEIITEILTNSLSKSYNKKIKKK